MKAKSGYGVSDTRHQIARRHARAFARCEQAPCAGPASSLERLAFAIMAAHDARPLVVTEPLFFPAPLRRVA